MSSSKTPTGLTATQVAEKTLAGQTNSYTIKSGKSVWRIIADNTFNLFIMLNFLIAAALIAVGSYTNALFILFVLVGIVSGTIAEIRAHKIVSKLTLMNKADITVVRDSTEQKIDPDTIVLGDVIKLVSGDQVPADAEVLSGITEVNESLLTGEPDLLVKKRGSDLISGSFITSGECYATVKHVGADNYATKLAIEAKTSKPVRSEILASIATVAKFTSRVIIPLGAILLFAALFIRHDSLKDAVVSSSAALLGMLPKGFAVLTIIALITATFKLSRKKVLVQEIYSVETMAHVDTLCLDKTGTLTDGKLRVGDLTLLSKKLSKKLVLEILGSYLTHSIDNNSTMEALKSFFDTNTKYPATKTIPFSSDRKWGAIYLNGVGMVIIGAPEKIFEQVPEGVAAKQQDGLRVLGLGLADKQDITSKGKLTGVTPLALIDLSDGIRKDAKKTLTYLKKQGIDLRVISGDSPLTVSHIAKRAGFDNYEHYLDVSGLSESDLRDAIPSTVIFGRVSPHQKRFIINELKSQGKTVAMTGDGVNDILAMRESDLSIVMAEGDSAAKQIGNIVLLESNFSELPDILFEGRRVVNNMFRVSSLFFIKTIYSFFVSVICAISVFTGSPIVFPFVAIQISIIDQVLEGFPTFFMSFEPDKSQVPQQFLKRSLLRALPQAIMVTLSLAFIYTWATLNDWSHIEMVTLMYYSLGTVMLIALIKACRPFTKLRVALIILSGLGFYISAFIIGIWFSDFIKIELLTSRSLIMLLIISAILTLAAFLIHYIPKFYAKAHKHKSKSPIAA